MKVEQFEDAKNQFVITGDNGERTFQSYKSIIAKRDGSQVVLDEKYWDYSKTTARYLGKFLGEPFKVVRKKVAEGVYPLVNLND